MTHELQSTLEASGIEWPALRNHIPCMAHVIQLASGAFMSSLGVKGCTMSWEAHERNQQFGENESVHIGKSQRLGNEGNARINKLSAMKPGLEKIIEKVHISRDFESAETNLHVAENACGINCANTWSSKRVHSLSNGQSPNPGISDYGREDPLELDPGVARARLPITWIHMQLAWKLKMLRLPATLHNSRWMDYREVYHGSVETIPILDPVDVEEAYSHIASQYPSVQWYVRSYGWRDASFSYEKHSIEGRLLLRRGVSSTEAVQILRWSDSIDGHTSHLCTYPRSFPEVPIFQKVGQRNGY